jgi:GWxTD domain-containing protein
MDSEKRIEIMKIKIINSLVIFFFLVASKSYSQGPEHPRGIVSMPKFNFEALTFSGEESGAEKLDVLIEIPYEALQFIKEGENFTARFEITVTINDTTENMVNEKFWRETIRVVDYEKTVSSKISYVNQKTFQLAPGSYIVSVNVKDMETENPVQQKKKVTVQPYSRLKFAVSDIMIASAVVTESTSVIVTPKISGSVGGSIDSFYVYFDVYNRTGADSAVISLIIKNMKNAVVRSDTFGQKLNDPAQGVYRVLKTDALIAGDYILELACYPYLDSIKGVSKTEVARANRRFSVRWKGMPLSITDLDLAIEQLMYITDRKDIDEMRQASPEKKRELFQRYWKSKDPTPQTERNEIMEEYYARVAYANAHFSYYLEGWKTDMGMIYILFGAPSNIERHPFEMNTKPYEIWSYYEQNREFIFVDVSGFGEYKLQNMDWDIRGIKPR